MGSMGTKLFGDPIPAKIILEGGFAFSGLAHGIESGTPRFGEFVFCTSMTGIEESLTDPSFARQVLVSTVSHVGNTGFTGEDKESPRIWTEGLVCRHLTDQPSNWRSKQSLRDWILAEGAFVVAGVDTRKFTEVLRDFGSQRGMVMSEADFSKINFEKAKALINENMPPMEGQNLTELVSTSRPLHFGTKNTHPRGKIGIWDFGCKANTLRILAQRGFEGVLLPVSTKAEDFLSLGLNGILLSNGPGDPAAATHLHEELRKLLGKLPLFAICLGHQLLAHALGAKTYKMKYGHRGIHHPVVEVDLKSKKALRTWITSQNHGFAVDPESLPHQASVWFVHADDQSVEGFQVPHLKIRSVQFHPEACPGPHDSEILIDQFLNSVNPKNDLEVNHETSILS